MNIDRTCLLQVCNHCLAAKLKAESQAFEAARLKASEEAAHAQREEARVQAEEEAARWKAEEEVTEMLRLKAEETLQAARLQARIRAEEAAQTKVKEHVAEEARVQAEHEAARLKAQLMVVEEAADTTGQCAENEKTAEESASAEAASEPDNTTATSADGDMGSELNKLQAHNIELTDLLERVQKELADVQDSACRALVADLPAGHWLQAHNSVPAAAVNAAVAPAVDSLLRSEIVQYFDFINGAGEVTQETQQYWPAGDVSSDTTGLAEAPAYSRSTSVLLPYTRILMEIASTLVIEGKICPQVCTALQLLQLREVAYLDCVCRKYGMWS